MSHINDVVNLHIAGLKKKRKIREVEDKLDEQLLQMKICQEYNDHLGYNKYKQEYNMIHLQYVELTAHAYEPKDYES